MGGLRERKKRGEGADRGDHGGNAAERVGDRGQPGGGESEEGSQRRQEIAKGVGVVEVEAEDGAAKPADHDHPDEQVAEPLQARWLAADERDPAEEREGGRRQAELEGEGGGDVEPSFGERRARPVERFLERLGGHGPGQLVDAIGVAPVDLGIVERAHRQVEKCREAEDADGGRASRGGDAGAREENDRAGRDQKQDGHEVMVGEPEAGGEAGRVQRRETPLGDEMQRGRQRGQDERRVERVDLGAGRLHPRRRGHGEAEGGPDGDDPAHEHVEPRCSGDDDLMRGHVEHGHRDRAGQRRGQAHPPRLIAERDHHERAPEQARQGMAGRMRNPQLRRRGDELARVEPALRRRRRPRVGDPRYGEDEERIMRTASVLHHPGVLFSGRWGWISTPFQSWSWTTRWRTSTPFASISGRSSRSTPPPAARKRWPSCARPTSRSSSPTSACPR